MHKINVSKSNTLKFSASIEGADPSKIKGTFNIILNEISCGFPVQVTGDSIIVKIPKLKDIIKLKVKSGVVVECSVELHDDCTFIPAWNEKCVLEIPTNVEAKLEENNHEENSEKKITIKGGFEEIEESCDGEHKEKEVKKESEIKTENIISRSERTKQLINKKLSTMENLIYKKEKVKKKIKKVKKVKENVSKPKKISSDFELTKLMESVGMKNKKVQEAMLIKVKENETNHSSRLEALNKILNIKNFV